MIMITGNAVYSLSNFLLQIVGISRKPTRFDPSKGVTFVYSTSSFCRACRRNFNYYVLHIEFRIRVHRSSIASELDMRGCRHKE
jgi:hypothetical protein